MVANLVLSAHGWASKSGDRKRQYPTTTVPAGVELVTYVEYGQNLFGNQAWAKWKELVESGREAQAYFSSQERLKEGSAIADYAIHGPHDAHDLPNWLYTPPQGAAFSACGLFEVGNTTALTTFAPGQQYGALSQYLSQAATRGSKRLYYLCCQALD